ncbi:MAG: hypothetical protein P4M08_05575 [Oligoflexia bacterium]|nr:hypothetical protein [Oligoflexia bacterium]
MAQLILDKKTGPFKPRAQLYALAALALCLTDSRAFAQTTACICESDNTYHSNGGQNCSMSGASCNFQGYSGSQIDSLADSNCRVSTEIGNGVASANGGNNTYDCTRTQSLARTTATVNQVGEAAGSLITQTVGQIGQTTAVNSGSQAASYNAGATTAEITAVYYGGLGAFNLYEGVRQYQDASQHSANAKSLSQTAQAASGGAKAGTFIDPSTAGNANSIITNSISSNQNVDGSANYGALQVAGNTITGKSAATGAAAGAVDPATKSQLQAVARTASAAATEQKDDAAQGNSAALGTMISGVTQLVQAGANMVQAEELKKAAAALSANTGTGVAFAPTQGALNPSSDTFASGSTAINPGTGAAPATAAATPTTPGGTTNLGSPFATGSNGGGGGAGATPSAFQPGVPNAVGGGAAAPLASTDTAPAQAQADNSQPKVADNGRQQFGYGGGGAAYVPGGVGSDKGENLSGLLSQLLPKKNEDVAQKDGIMSFANRNPASVNTLLGRDVNLFKRIEESMQSNYRRGAVGI